jgi:hypothetical protein
MIESTGDGFAAPEGGEYGVEAAGVGSGVAGSGVTGSVMVGSSARIWWLTCFHRARAASIRPG